MSLRQVVPSPEAASSCLVVAVLLLVGTVGCTRDATSKPEAPRTIIPKAESPKTESPTTKTSAPPPTETPASKVPTKPSMMPSRVAGSHILISFVGAENRASDISRTKEEAKTRAEKVKELARKPETVWEDVVHEFSDDPNASANGGRIGILEAHQREHAHEFAAIGDAIFEMEIGQVSEVVESPLGYHVVTRMEIVEYSAYHILVQYAGCKDAGAPITRTKEEAKARAEEALSKARAKSADLTTLIVKYSDGPAGPNPGYLGILPAGAMVPEIEEALAAIKIGELTGPVETQFGFHVLRREKIYRIGASHILITFIGSKGPKKTMLRTKEAALELAEQVADEAKAPGADFAALALKYSEGPNAADGGYLGLIGYGELDNAFNEAAFALEPDDIAGPVETQFGFHIILRTE